MNRMFALVILKTPTVAGVLGQGSSGAAAWTNTSASYVSDSSGSSLEGSQASSAAMR